MTFNLGLLLSAHKQLTRRTEHGATGENVHLAKHELVASTESFDAATYMSHNQQRYVLRVFVGLMWCYDSHRSH